MGSSAPVLLGFQVASFFSARSDPIPMRLLRIGGSFRQVFLAHGLLNEIKFVLAQSPGFVEEKGWNVRVRMCQVVVEAGAACRVIELSSEMQRVQS